jgi:hypothetical protein
MPALLALFGTFGLNYALHKTGRPTICSTLRPHVGPWLMSAVVGGFVGWFLPHYCRPFVVAALNEIDDTRPEIASFFDVDLQE